MDPCRSSGDGASSERVEDCRDSGALNESFLRACEGDPAARSQLIEQAARGDATAQDHLLRWIRPILREKARQLFRGKDRAPYGISDLVQSGLNKAFKSMGFLEVRTGGGFLQWMKKILENHYHDLERKRARRILEASGDPLDGTERRAMPESMQSRLPEDELEQAEEVDRMLSLLGVEDRRIVFLRQIVELDNGETAAHLRTRGVEISADAVRMRYRRALDRLYETLNTPGRRASGARDQSDGDT